MQDYSIEKLVILNGRTICYGNLDDYDRVKTIFIANDFDIDDDCGNHFSGMRSLERFKVCDKRSRFYTEDGVLFVNLRIDDKIREKEMLYDFPKDVAGKVLIAFPTNYPQTKYSVPDGTVAIAKGAFSCTNIEELTLPSSLRFIDFHALDNTNCLRVLKVPNSAELIIMDHFTIGKQCDFSIFCNNGSEQLNEDVLHLWVSLTEPYVWTDQNEENLGKTLYDHVSYTYEIIWPDEYSQEELSVVLMNKNNILSYYKGAKQSDVDSRIMFALFLFKLDTHLLHPSTSCEAEIILDMLFGDTGVNENWLKKYAGSPQDYKKLHSLLNSDKVKFLDYIGSSTMHVLLKHRSETILEPLAEQGYIGAIVNLLHIRDVHFYDESPSFIEKAAKLGDPVSIWAIASRMDLNKGSERAVAVNLWERLSDGKNLLPYMHKEDIRWSARNNLKWIESHNLEEEIKINYPQINIPDEYESLYDDYLHDIVYKGAKKRYGEKLSDECIKRIDYELGYIRKFGCAQYYILLFDIIKYARENKIWIGAGRGKDASSIVCYCLFIIDIDPIKYGLSQYRAFWKTYNFMPDVDLDISKAKRNNLLDYIRGKFGEKNVLRVLLDFNYWPIHPCAFFILDCDRGNSIQKVLQYVEDEKREVYVVNKTKRDMENLGLLNFDMLSAGHIDFIHDVCCLVEDNSGRIIDISNICTEDKNVLDFFCNSETDGIFQFSSLEMKNYLKVVQPSSFNDLVVLNALCRPLLEENIPVYARRKKGKETIPDYGRANYILQSTYGIPVFTEQIVQIFMEIGDLSQYDSNMFLHMLIRNKYAGEYEMAFRKGCNKSGVSDNDIDIIWELVHNYSSHVFDKSHATAYTFMGYQCAWLKTYFPQEFSTILNKYDGTNKW